MSYFAAYLNHLFHFRERICQISTELLISMISKFEGICNSNTFLSGIYYYFIVSILKLGSSQSVVNMGSNWP